MTVTSTDFIHLADQIFPQPSSADLSEAGPASRFLRDNVTKSEERTRPFVAAIFWQAYMMTPSFHSFLRAVRARQPDFRVRLTQVVPHAGRSSRTRFDLLILIDDYEDPELFAEAHAELSVDELIRGSAELLSGREGLVYRSGALGQVDHARIAVEAYRQNPFAALAFPAPKMIQTAFVTSPPERIREPASGATSTAGVHCVNGNGQRGVTAALHAVAGSVGGAVELDGVRGRIVSQEALSDSAFVEVALRGRTARTRIKPLRGLVPRVHEPVTFEGSTSGKCEGNVVGSSPQLPTVTGNSQLVVTTGPISQAGDSGAALLDMQGTLLGFCHEVSEFGADNPYSSWIWAESVFKAHNLS